MKILLGRASQWTLPTKTYSVAPPGKGRIFNGTRMSQIIRFLLALLPIVLAGCIAGREPLYEGVAVATPLPAEFTLVGESEDEKRAWKVTLEDGVYVWHHADEILRTRLFPLAGEGVRPGFYVAAADDEDQGVLYGLAEIRGRDIISYTAEVAPLAKSLGVATENSTYTTKFASRADLETVFAALAAKLPVDASDKVMIDGVEVKLGRFVTYDPAVPAEREEAREMLSKYGDN